MDFVTLGIGFALGVAFVLLIKFILYIVGEVLGEL